MFIYSRIYVVYRKDTTGIWGRRYDEQVIIAEVDNGYYVYSMKKGTNKLYNIRKSNKHAGLN